MRGSFGPARATARGQFYLIIEMIAKVDLSAVRVTFLPGTANGLSAEFSELNFLTVAIIISLSTGFVIFFGSENKSDLFPQLCT